MFLLALATICSTFSGAWAEDTREADLVISDSYQVRDSDLVLLWVEDTFYGGACKDSSVPSCTFCTKRLFCTLYMVDFCARDTLSITLKTLQYWAL